MTPTPPTNGPFHESHLRLVLNASADNREVLAQAARCGCYSCGEIFTPAAIRHWVDVPHHLPANPSPAQLLPRTAVCPHCDVDAVVAETAWLPLSPALVAAARTRWFAYGDPIPLPPTRTDIPPRHARIPRAPVVVIPPDDRVLLAGARRFGEWLCTLPEATYADHAAIRAVLAEWAKLPALTPGFVGEFGCVVVDRLVDPPLRRRWIVQIDEPDDSVVVVYTFAHDDETDDIWHAMAHECWHAWHRGAAETDEDRDPAQWLADLEALPAIRAHGKDFEIEATVRWADGPAVTA